MVLTCIDFFRLKVKTQWFPKKQLHTNYDPFATTKTLINILEMERNSNNNRA